MIARSVYGYINMAYEMERQYKRVMRHKDYG